MQKNLLKLISTFLTCLFFTNTNTQITQNLSLNKYTNDIVVYKGASTKLYHYKQIAFSANINQHLIIEFEKVELNQMKHVRPSVTIKVAGDDNKFPHRYFFNSEKAFSTDIRSNIVDPVF